MSKDTQINYIDKNIENLSTEQKCYIVKLIYLLENDSDLMKHNGNAVWVKYDDINDKTIKSIYEYIKSKLIIK
jgi:hypothetical protein